MAQAAESEHAVWVEPAILNQTAEDLYTLLVQLPPRTQLQNFYKIAAENGKIDHLLALIQYELDTIVSGFEDEDQGAESRWARYWRFHKRHCSRRGKLVANLYTAMLHLFQCGLTGYQHLLKFAEALVDNKIDLNMTDGKGDTLLMRMACHPAFGPAHRLKPVLQKLLLGNLCLCQQNKFGETALSKAVLFYNFTMARILIEVGADLLTKDYRGRLPLHEMAERGADSSLEGENVFELVQLLSNRSDKEVLDAKDNMGLTPLMIAAGFAHHHVASSLLQCGCDPNIVAERQENMTAVHSLLYSHAKAGPGKRRAELLNLMLQHGADPNRPLRCGITPLMLAVKTCNPTAVKTLLQWNCSVRSSNLTVDAMWDALAHPDLNMHQMLLAAGYSINDLRVIVTQLMSVQTHYQLHSKKTTRELYAQLPIHLLLAESIFVKLSSQQLHLVQMRSRSPYSLKQSCRSKVRSILNGKQGRFQINVASLGLPSLLMDYICLKSIENMI